MQSRSSRKSSVSPTSRSTSPSTISNYSAVSEWILRQTGDNPNDIEAIHTRHERHRRNKPVPESPASTPPPQSRPLQPKLQAHDHLPLSSYFDVEEWISQTNNPPSPSLSDAVEKKPAKDVVPSYYHHNKLTISRTNTNTTTTTSNSNSTKTTTSTNSFQSFDHHPFSYYHRYCHHHSATTSSSSSSDSPTSRGNNGGNSAQHEVTANNTTGITIDKKSGKLVVRELQFEFKMKESKKEFSHSQSHAHSHPDLKKRVCLICG